jgi:hypothetical protein
MSSRTSEEKAGKMNEREEIDPKAVVEDQFGRFLVEGKQCPTPLPDELKSWYCYTNAYGHSLAVALKSRFASHKAPLQFLELAPVKTVLRGYDVVDGYIVIDVPYTTQIGLQVPPGDREW